MNINANQPPDNIDRLIAQVNSLPEPHARPHLDSLLGVAAAYQEAGNTEVAERAYDAAILAFERYRKEALRRPSSDPLSAQYQEHVPLWSYCALHAKDYSSLEALEAAGREDMRQRERLLAEMGRAWSR